MHRPMNSNGHYKIKMQEVSDVGESNLRLAPSLEFGTLNLSEPEAELPAEADKQEWSYTAPLLWPLQASSPEDVTSVRRRFLPSVQDPQSSKRSSSPTPSIQTEDSHGAGSVSSIFHQFGAMVGLWDSSDDTHQEPPCSIDWADSGDSSQQREHMKYRTQVMLDAARIQKQRRAARSDLKQTGLGHKAKPLPTWESGDFSPTLPARDYDPELTPSGNLTSTTKSFRSAYLLAQQQNGGHRLDGCLRAAPPSNKALEQFHVSPINSPRDYESVKAMATPFTADSQQQLSSLSDARLSSEAAPPSLCPARPHNASLLHPNQVGDFHESSNSAEVVVVQRMQVGEVHPSAHSAPAAVAQHMQIGKVHGSADSVKGGVVQHMHMQVGEKDTCDDSAEVAVAQPVQAGEVDQFAPPASTLIWRSSPASRLRPGGDDCAVVMDCPQPVKTQYLLSARVSPSSPACAQETEGKDMRTAATLAMPLPSSAHPSLDAGVADMHSRSAPLTQPRKAIDELLAKAALIRQEWQDLSSTTAETFSPSSKFAMSMAVSPRFGTAESTADPNSPQTTELSLEMLPESALTAISQDREDSVLSRGAVQPGPPASEPALQESLDSIQPRTVVRLAAYEKMVKDVIGADMQHCKRMLSPQALGAPGSPSIRPCVAVQLGVPATDSMLARDSTSSSWVSEPSAQNHKASTVSDDPKDCKSVFQHSERRALEGGGDAEVSTPLSDEEGPASVSPLIQRQSRRLASWQDAIASSPAENQGILHHMMLQDLRLRKANAILDLWRTLLDALSEDAALSENDLMRQFNNLTVAVAGGLQFSQVDGFMHIVTECIKKLVEPAMGEDSPEMAEDKFLKELKEFVQLRQSVMDLNLEDRLSELIYQLDHLDDFETKQAVVADQLTQDGEASEELPAWSARSEPLSEACPPVAQEIVVESGGFDPLFEATRAEMHLPLAHERIQRIQRLCGLDPLCEALPPVAQEVVGNLGGLDPLCEAALPVTQEVVGELGELEPVCKATPPEKDAVEATAGDSNDTAEVTRDLSWERWQQSWQRLQELTEGPVCPAPEARTFTLSRQQSCAESDTFVEGAFALDALEEGHLRLQPLECSSSVGSASRDESVTFVEDAFAPQPLEDDRVCFQLLMGSSSASASRVESNTFVEDAFAPEPLEDDRVCFDLLMGSSSASAASCTEPDACAEGSFALKPLEEVSSCSKSRAACDLQLPGRSLGEPLKDRLDELVDIGVEGAFKPLAENNDRPLLSLVATDGDMADVEAAFSWALALPCDTAGLSLPFENPEHSCDAHSPSRRSSFDGNLDVEGAFGWASPALPSTPSQSAPSRSLDVAANARPRRISLEAKVVWCAVDTADKATSIPPTHNATASSSSCSGSRRNNGMPRTSGLVPPQQNNLEAGGELVDVNGKQRRWSTPQPRLQHRSGSKLGSLGSIKLQAFDCALEPIAQAPTVANRRTASFTPPVVSSPVFVERRIPHSSHYLT